MEVNQRFGNIIIMAPDIYMDDFLIEHCNDFYVGSYCNQYNTACVLQSAIIGLKNSNDILLLNKFERILLMVQEVNSMFYHFSLDSPISKEKTLHILTRTSALLQDPSSQINFFYPK